MAFKKDIDLYNVGLVTRNPDCVASEQQKRWPACASAQSGQRLFSSLSIEYDS